MSYILTSPNKRQCSRQHPLSLIQHVISGTFRQLFLLNPIFL